MQLIAHEGLNCYQSCVASLAQHHSLPYWRAYAGLWTAREAYYEALFERFTPPAFQNGFAQIGLVMSRQQFENPLRVRELLENTWESQFAIIGLDAFYVPWSPIYQLAHEHHYFIAGQAVSGMLPCFDPAYHRQDVQISLQTLKEYAFDVRFGVLKSQAAYMPDVAGITSRLPACLRAIDEKIHASPQTARSFVDAARYVDCQIQNRTLFQHFLTREYALELFSKDYFTTWMALKNGLMMASVLKKREKILNQVQEKWELLQDRERKLANQKFI